MKTTKTKTKTGAKSAWGGLTPALKRDWLKRLLSGRYKQGRGQLRDNDRHYCCLGVLCVAAGKKYDGDLGYPVLDADEGPKPFCGLTAKAQIRLAKMNDDGKTFKEIAAWIKRYL